MLCDLYVQCAVAVVVYLFSVAATSCAVGVSIKLQLKFFYVQNSWFFFYQSKRKLRKVLLTLIEACADNMEIEEKQFANAKKKELER